MGGGVAIEYLKGKTSFEGEQGLEDDCSRLLLANGCSRNSGQ